MPTIKTSLFILLGLCLGSGLTLIALQERFVRERRRLLAMSESQRTKSAHAAVAVSTKQWEQKCQQLEEDLHAVQTQLAFAEANPPPIDPKEFVPRSEHERLIQEKNSELTRLTADHKMIASQLTKDQEEINELQAQIAFLGGEVSRLERAKTDVSVDDDFLLLGPPGGHLLPGSVVRAFIKGH